MDTIPKCSDGTRQEQYKMTVLSKEVFQTRSSKLEVLFALHSNIESVLFVHTVSCHGVQKKAGSTWVAGKTGGQKDQAQGWTATCDSTIGISGTEVFLFSRSPGIYQDLTHI